MTGMNFQTRSMAVSAKIFLCINRVLAYIIQERDQRNNQMRAKRRMVYYGKNIHRKNTDLQIE
ncbi:hypothetical protein [uncultured Robinsoniella sp.]|uniref:hypothetical protein n=1 Tax=Robinsoniella sp. TaxID=2496533 RepID=UPI00374F9DC1